LRRRDGAAWLAFLTVFLLVGAGTALIAFAHGVETPGSAHPAPAVEHPAPALAAGSVVDKRVGRLPLVDEHGHATSLAAFRGKWVVLAPSLTLCHEVCPLTTGALGQLQRDVRSRGLGDRVVVAEATVDPWRDTPARIRAFKRLTGTDVRFLTGTRSEIAGCGRRSASTTAACRRTTRRTATGGPTVPRRSTWSTPTACSSSRPTATGVSRYRGCPT